MNDAELGKAKVIREKLVLVPLCPPNIPHGILWG
jgi:hypothetical protein